MECMRSPSGPHIGLACVIMCGIHSNNQPASSCICQLAPCDARAARLPIALNYRLSPPVCRYAAASHQLHESYYLNLLNVKRERSAGIAATAPLHFPLPPNSHERLRPVLRSRTHYSASSHIHRTSRPDGALLVWHGAMKVQGCNGPQLAKTVPAPAGASPPDEQLAWVSMGLTTIPKLSLYKHADQLQRLSLHGNRIAHLENLGSLQALTALVLSGNRLRSLGNGLAGLTNLVKLDLANNLLPGVEGLQGLSALSHLVPLPAQTSNPAPLCTHSMSSSA